MLISSILFWVHTFIQAVMQQCCELSDNYIYVAKIPMYVLVGVVVHVELVDAIQVVFGLTKDFAGAGTTRNLVMRRVSPGRNTKNTDS